MTKLKALLMGAGVILMISDPVPFAVTADRYGGSRNDYAGSRNDYGGSRNDTAAATTTAAAGRLRRQPE